MRQSTGGLSIWDALHWASAGIVTAVYAVALYATVSHVPSRPHRYYEQLRVGVGVGLSGLLVGELLLCLMAVVIARRGGTVQLPAGLPVTGNG